MVAGILSGGDPVVNDLLSGIVIAGAGAGSFSGLWSEKVQEAIAAGAPVVDCSRIGNGLVSGGWNGMVAGYNLPPQKAVVLLRLALTVTDDPEAIQEMFLKY